MSFDQQPPDSSDENSRRDNDDTGPIPTQNPTSPIPRGDDGWARPGGSSAAGTDGTAPGRPTGDGTAQPPRYGATPAGGHGAAGEPSDGSRQAPQYGQRAPQGGYGQQAQYGPQGQQNQSGPYPGPGQQTPARPGQQQSGQFAQSGPFGQQRPQQGQPAQFGGPVGMQAQGAPADQQQGNSGKRRGWGAVPVAAVLAAALASGGTYALTRGDDSGSAAEGNTSIVKADPADVADAGSVNWSATAAKISPSVVSITVVSGSSGDQGSGVVLDKKGNIVTNNHVVAAVSNPTVTVTLNDNKTYKAKVVGTDPSTDLAVIRLEDGPSDLTPVSMADDSKLVVGQPVMAVGNPLGLSGTVTTGIVSALNRPVTTQQTSDDDGSDSQGGSSSSATSDTVTTNAIQTSAAINPGNSGGALVNGSGKLIGINSSIATLGQSSATSQSGNIGIGFAIPVPVVKNISQQLIESGKAKHAELGVGVSPTAASVEVDGATEKAAKIASVKSGGPAAKAGIKVGDVVVRFDGQQVVSSDSLVGFVRAKTIGAKAKLTIIRDGQQKNVTVTLGEASSS